MVIRFDCRVSNSLQIHVCRSVTCVVWGVCVSFPLKDTVSRVHSPFGDFGVTTDTLWDLGCQQEVRTPAFLKVSYGPTTLGATKTDSGPSV